MFLNSKYIAMDKLQIEVIRQIYEYDSTYKIKVGKVLKQLSAHCSIYRCSECFNKWNTCYCYCVTCGTYFRVCRQIYFDQASVYEYNLNDIIQLGL